MVIFRASSPPKIALVSTAAEALRGIRLAAPFQAAPSSTPPPSPSRPAGHFGSQSFPQQQRFPPACSIRLRLKSLAMVPQPVGPNANQAEDPTIWRRITAAAESLRPIHQARSKSGREVARGVLLSKDLHLYAPDRHEEPTVCRITSSVSGFSGNAARTIRLNLDYTVTPTFLIALHGWLERPPISCLGPEDFLNIQSTLGLSGAISPGRGLPLIATESVLSNVAEERYGQSGAAI